MSCLSDEKVVIHGYRAMDDKKFNEFLPLGLGFFDAVMSEKINEILYEALFKNKKK